ncbi:MAG: cupin domain-containing protein [Pseudomonadota bacterium]
MTGRMAAEAMQATEIIDRLGLAPHPEGGWFRETWRGGTGLGDRAAGTAILFLLEAEQRSHWHRVDAAEIWHFYAGHPLALSIHTGGRTETWRLGRDLAAGEQPQIIVPANAWQAAVPQGGWSLMGCTVSPAFEFSGFVLARPGWDPDRDPMDGADGPG